MIEVVFFDIGNTLASRSPDGTLAVFPTSPQLLQVMGSVLRLRLGVITNLPSNMTTGDIRKLLSDANLLAPLDPQGVVTNRDAGFDKPDVRIYQFAAQQLGVSVCRCLFIGENQEEVDGAVAAGMNAILKPFPP